MRGVVSGWRSSAEWRTSISICGFPPKHPFPSQAKPTESTIWGIGHIVAYQQIPQQLKLLLPPLRITQALTGWSHRCIYIYIFLCLGLDRKVKSQA